METEADGTSLTFLGHQLFARYGDRQNTLKLAPFFFFLAAKEWT